MRPGPLISRRDQSRFHVSGIRLKQGAYLLSKSKINLFDFVPLGARLVR